MSQELLCLYMKIMNIMYCESVRQNNDWSNDWHINTCIVNKCQVKIWNFPSLHINYIIMQSSSITTTVTKWTKWTVTSSNFIPIVTRTHTKRNYFKKEKQAFSQPSMIDDGPTSLNFSVLMKNWPRYGAISMWHSTSITNICVLYHCNFQFNQSQFYTWINIWLL